MATRRISVNLLKEIVHKMMKSNLDASKNIGKGKEEYERALRLEGSVLALGSVQEAIELWEEDWRLPIKLMD